MYNVHVTVSNVNGGIFCHLITGFTSLDAANSVARELNNSTANHSNIYTVAIAIRAN